MLHKEEQMTLRKVSTRNIGKRRTTQPRARMRRPNRARRSAQRTQPARAVAASGSHPESEDHPWTINIGNHPQRKDAPAYVKARKIMLQIAPQTGWFLGGGPYQDHHGGALWVKDEQGWFMLKNLAGIEWSAQFAADPSKVDKLRQNARRLYSKFPLTAKAFKAMGFDLDALLNTEIHDAAGVAAWTDSICNAGVPLAAPWHTGVLATTRSGEKAEQRLAAAAKSIARSRTIIASGRGSGRNAVAHAKAPIIAGGVHHYPAPITDIQFFKRDDFTLWVTDEQGQVAAVVPTENKAEPAEVVYATPGTRLHDEWLAKHATGDRLMLPAAHPIAARALSMTGLT